MFYELHHFFMFGMGGHGKGLQKREDFGPVLEIPTSKLTDDERMTENMSLIQQRLKSNRSISQMYDPHRGVNKDHFIFPRSFCDESSPIYFRSRPIWRVSYRFPAL